MWAYIIRRSFLMIPTVVGVLLLTFILFAVICKDPAQAFAGRQASEGNPWAAIRVKMGLDKPRFFNFAATTRPVLVHERLRHPRDTCPANAC